MNAKQIARIFEVLFSDYPGEEGAPEPVNKRFNWVDPKTGKKPPTPPKEMLPTAKDMRDLDTEFTVPPGHDVDPVHAYPEPAKRPGLPDDRTGSVSMSQMLPKSEMATIDDLLDQYMRIKATKGEQAARDWFNMYRSAEFESAIRKLIGVFLGD